MLKTGWKSFVAEFGLLFALGASAMALAAAPSGPHDSNHFLRVTYLMPEGQRNAVMTITDPDALSQIEHRLSNALSHAAPVQTATAAQAHDGIVVQRIGAGSGPQFVINGEVLRVEGHTAASGKRFVSAMSARSADVADLEAQLLDMGYRRGTLQTTTASRHD